MRRYIKCVFAKLRHSQKSKQILHRLVNLAILKAIEVNLSGGKVGVT